jgi:hypothetical protein
MERKRIYIVVKTYPTISNTYDELVCTAGILEDGSWVRLYPVPFRKLEDYKQYKKYSWIELCINRNTNDFRVETYNPYDLDSMIIEDNSSKHIDWHERNDIIFNTQKIYTDMNEVIALAKNNQSLAIFKPTKITNFSWEEVDREWDAEKLRNLKAKSQQLSFFEKENDMSQEFKIVDKIPYRFNYTFEDITGKKRELMIEDWEVSALYLNCIWRGDSEEVALQKVKQKYMELYTNRNLYFFLGTTKKWHNVAPNPFIIIGLYYPPKILPPRKEKVEQISIFDD